MVNSASPKDGKTSHSRQQIIKEFLQTYGRLVAYYFIETDCYFHVHGPEIFLFHCSCYIGSEANYKGWMGKRKLRSIPRVYPSLEKNFYQR
jgi:hypothetical protein